MLADMKFAREIADRQVAMFAMFVGPGLYTTRAALAEASRIPASTLKEWAGGSAMPFHGAMLLAKFLPREAINMICEPAGMRLADASGEDQGNWDLVAASAAGFTAEVCAARSDGRITPSEDARLRKIARKLIADAQTVVTE
jgi:hypothetical protein